MKKQSDKKPEYIEYEDGTRVLLDEDDSPEWTDEMFAKAKRGRAGLEDIFGKSGAEALISRNVGRPKAINPKKQISFLFDADIVERLKHTMKYNVMVEHLLREAMVQGRI